jgi:hypothetical protein
VRTAGNVVAHLGIVAQLSADVKLYGR